MDSHTFVLLLLIGCLCLMAGSWVAAAPACNGGFYSKNGNLVIDIQNLQSHLNCVQNQHQRG
ncbi:uncharacterized protein LOC110185575 [Drosophila serrata]|uniref:uncharacterized protein LOC110185575 n=1 Tax=Drosophila serrata TaxID=7274 RepID=UPI000A1D0B4D|nr:uncharacterized protein LOC110185575 [Drosophila serrata]